MRAHLADRAPGRRDEMIVLEIEFTSKARRVRVEASDGLEALDLRGERAGGTYDAAPTLPRLHVPLRVTRDGPGTGRVRVVVEDVAGAIAAETWDGQVVLEGTKAAAGAARTGLWLGAFAVTVAALVYFVGLPLFQPPKVPTLVGRARADAERTLKSLGIAPVTETVDARTDRDVGVVIGQSPEGGSRVAKGSTVVITVGRSPSAPPGLGAAVGVVVPELVGRTLSEAEAALGGTGLLLNPLAEDAAEEQEGRVLRQRPAPGGRSLPGTAIEVVVGKKRVASDRDVPDVSGLARADAEKALTDAQLTVLVTEEDAEPARVGRVVRQSPPGGARAPSGSAVGLVIGREKAASAGSGARDRRAAPRPGPASRGCREGADRRRIRRRRDAGRDDGGPCGDRALAGPPAGRRAARRPRQDPGRTGGRYHADTCTRRADAGPRRADAGPRRADAGPRRADAGPGRADAGPRRADAGPGRADAGPGRADAGAGRADTGTGRADAGPGRADTGSGRADAGAGRADAGSGRADAGARRADTGPGRADARPHDARAVDADARPRPDRHGSREGRGRAEAGRARRPRELRGRPGRHP